MTIAIPESPISYTVDGSWKDDTPWDDQEPAPLPIDDLNLHHPLGSAQAERASAEAWYKTAQQSFRDARYWETRARAAEKRYRLLIPWRLFQMEIVEGRIVHAYNNTGGYLRATIVAVNGDAVTLRVHEIEEEFTSQVVAITNIVAIEVA